MADEQTEPTLESRWRALFIWPPPPRARVPLAVGAAVLAGLLYLVVSAALAPRMVDVARGQQPEDTQAAVTALEAQGIVYALGAGGAIRVPEAQIHVARLAVATTLGAGHAVGFELFNESELGRSAYTEKVNFKRATEGELARTISSLDAVDRARVHLTMPERRLFEEDEVLPTASVQVILRSGAELSRANVQAVRHLVAGAVVRLRPDQVSVVDQRGKILAHAADEGFAFGSVLEQQARYERDFERSLEARIVELMSPVVGGRDHVKATVAAEFDFSHELETEETFNPDSQVIRSEREQSELAETQENVAAGAPGTATNLPDRAAAANRSQASPRKSERLDHIKNYEIDKRTLRRETPNPRLTRLSVGVVLDEQVPSADPDRPARAWTDEEMAAHTSLLSKAVGIDPERGDAIEVMSFPFSTVSAAGPAPVQAAGLWSTERIAWTVGGGVFAILLLLLASRFWRRSRDEHRRNIELRRRREVASEEARIREEELAQLEAPLPIQERIERLRGKAIRQGDDDVLSVVSVLRRWMEPPRRPMADGEDVSGPGAGLQLGKGPNSEEAA